MFEQLTWEPDRALLGDLVFRLEQTGDDGWERGVDCFALYKNRQLLPEEACVVDVADPEFTGARS
ncbi:MAG: hypothetical protein QOJ39_679 [Candidatus Eremiobacteraeota bacterium]|nr:hypothetical protein [Candidatus Eremiobacteraeota bacterium]